jgi:hypothetical protein
MRKRYVQRFIDGEWRLIEGASRPRSDAPYVIPDIDPYRSTITGEVIGSRSVHRAHLKQHGCIEIGNEKWPKRKPEPMPDLIPDLRQAVREVRRKQGW